MIIVTSAASAICFYIHFMGHAAGEGFLSVTAKRAEILVQNLKDAPQEIFHENDVEFPGTTWKTSGQTPYSTKTTRTLPCGTYTHPVDI